MQIDETNKFVVVKSAKKNDTKAVHKFGSPCALTALSCDWAEIAKMQFSEIVRKLKVY